MISQGVQVVYRICLNDDDNRSTNIHDSDENDILTVSVKMK